MKGIILFGKNCVGKYLYIAFVIYILISCNDDDLAYKNFLSVIPEPSEIKIEKEFLVLDSIMLLSVDNAFRDISGYADLLTEFMKDNFENAGQYGSKAFNIINRLSLGAEGYELLVNGNGVNLYASARKGVLYGLQTFFQICLSAADNKIPYLIIRDSPRFSHRGLMLDPARHFIPVDEIKRLISIMSFYKYNCLHLHLSDDEGWCVEIKGLSILKEKGFGSPTMDSGGRNLYTQEELKDLVAFAAEYEVEIIPEIDIPGHCSYITSLFPDLKCGNVHMYNAPGQLCVGNDKVVDFMNIVVAEFAEIFPSNKFHLGGDEFSMKTIESCETCQSKMKELGYESEGQLVSHMFENVAKIVEENGKTSMFWHETIVPSYPQNSVLYSWRKGLFSDALYASNNNNYKLICSPEEYSYFNYPQMPKGEPPFDNWGMPAIDLHRVYSFDPTFGYSSEQTKNLIGVEALLWNEYITSIDMMYYMIFPRALAFSEVGWSLPKNRDWKRFCKKLDFHLNYISRKGINYRRPS